MKALVKSKAETGLWLEDVAIPSISDNDVLIKIKKTAICGTDLHIYNWDHWAQQTIPVPMVVGHEFCGEIAEVGKNVSHLKKGMRVSGEGHITCKTCRNCRAGRQHLCRETFGVGVNRPGAFAEFLAIPADNVFVLPDEISDDLAAILDPFGNATHTALSFDLVGEDVLITGAGPIGIMAGCIAKHAGARHVVITDVNDYRLDLAKKLGITNAINVSNTDLKKVMQQLKIIEGFDVGLEMSGNAIALRQMIDVANHGAKLALLGILPDDAAIDWDKVIFKSLILKGIYGREMFETWYKMSSMLQGSLDINKIITHKFNVDNFEEGFATMLSGKSGKVILEW